MIYTVEKTPVLISAALIAIFMATGLWRAKSNNKIISTLKKPTILIGNVIKSPRLSTSKKYYYFPLKTIAARTRSNKIVLCSGVVTILIKDDLYNDFTKKNILDTGARLTLKGSLLKDDAFIVNNIESDGYFPPNKLYTVRAKVRQAIKKRLTAWGRAGGLFLALLLGSRDTLDIKMADAFKATGTSFILALSGMHLGLWAAIVLMLTKKYLRKGVAIAISFAVISVFVFIVGTTPSLLRSYIFFIVTLFFMMLSVELSFLNRLAVTFLIHIAAAPNDFYTIAFQLSYLAVLGMIVLPNIIGHLIPKCVPRYIALPLTQSISCNVATFWVTIKTFGYWNPIGILAGVVLSPFIVLFMYAGLIFLIIEEALPFTMGACALIMKIIYNVIERIITIFANFNPILL